jgi:cysteinyl-tRNA synthetase
MTSYVNQGFLKLARHYETKFQLTMSEFNILLPNITTRISDYIPEIIKCIEKIIQNGYTYTLNSSIYFDSIQFIKQHSNEDLKSYLINDICSSNQDEETSSASKDTIIYKKSNLDFVLWNKSEPYEPQWISPWGLGRPGPFFNCNLMCKVLYGNKSFYLL